MAVQHRWSDADAHAAVDRYGQSGVAAELALRTYSARLLGADPELVLLSSEPYPFSEKHFAEIEAILPDASLALADGEMFSWYGSRMRLAPD